ncbi:hypothetical protein [Halovivax sp.]|uniref:hypothetical protein n=1 Tax=Halovivax sp. TaxID=1935978 RepID=UPI0025BDFE84|nr:hypothetical protein [Halovivax sp.]
MSLADRRSARKLVREFIERDMVPPNVEDEVVELVENERPLRALAVVLEAR